MTELVAEQSAPQSESTTSVPPHVPGVEADDTNSTSIVLIGLISTALVLCSALGVTALFDWYMGKLTAEKVTAAVYSEAENAVIEQENRLYGSPRLVDEATGAYSIPIEDAMNLVVREVQSEQSATNQPE